MTLWRALWQTQVDDNSSSSSLHSIALSQPNKFLDCYVAFSFVNLLCAFSQSLLDSNHLLQVSSREGHPKEKLSMFCALSQNYQHFCEKIM